MVEKEKFFKKEIWFSKSIRVLGLTPSALGIIEYILEETWSKYSGKWVSLSNYQLDKYVFYKKDSKKGARGIKNLKERNLLVYEENKYKLNFNVESWKITNEERIIINQILRKNV